MVPWTILRRPAPPQTEEKHSHAGPVLPECAPSSSQKGAGEGGNCLRP
jgi:hypothetical protein